MDVDSYYLEQDERMDMESEEQDEIMESLSSFARCVLAPLARSTTHAVNVTGASRHKRVYSKQAIHLQRACQIPPPHAYLRPLRGGARNYRRLKSHRPFPGWASVSIPFELGY